MRNKNSILCLGILVLVLFLGVGYAVVSSVYLNIGGTASVGDFNLNVEITNAEATTSVADKTVNFNHVLSDGNLTSRFTLDDMLLDEKVTITYTITNNDYDVDAIINSNGVLVYNSNYEYFFVNYKIVDGTTDVENGDKTMTVLVYVEVIKTPVTEEDSSATLELSFIASPKGSDSSSESGTVVEAIPLQYGQKYYLATIWNADIRHLDSWYSFYENGSLTQSDSGLNLYDSGYTYSKTNIYHSELLSDNAEFLISSDGKFLTLTDGYNISGMFVLESEYNNLKTVPVKFGQNYVCITDNGDVVNQSNLGVTLKFFPDGSIESSKDGEIQLGSSGTVSYNKNEIIFLEFPEEEIKIIVSDDGSTISYMYGEEVLLVYTLQD